MPDRARQVRLTCGCGRHVPIPLRIHLDSTAVVHAPSANLVLGTWRCRHCKQSVLVRASDLFLAAPLAKEAG